jgi:hypothetical protein
MERTARTAALLTTSGERPTTTTNKAMGTRINRRECWGPLTPTDLLRKLAAEHNWVSSEASGCGRHPSHAALIAWDGLGKQYRAGKPLNPARLPFHAQRVTARLQLQTCDW